MLNLDKNKKYLLALSGGPDSMALFSMLHEENYHFIACLINYHHRKEADDEAKGTQEYVENNHEKIIVKDAYYQKGNFEDWARVFRYETFSQLVKEYHLDGCIVAHHEDDLLETYFLQKERGYVSYYGLKSEATIKGITIYRPLLTMKKSELEEYCKNHNVPYFIDATNFDKTIKRNFYRHDVIAKLNDSERNNLLKEIASLNKKIESIYININKVQNYADFLKLNEEEQDYYLYQLVHDELDNSVILSKSRLHDIKTKLSKDGNVVVKLNNDYNLVKEYTSLRLVKNDLINYVLKVDKPSFVENDYVMFDLRTHQDALYIKDADYPLTIEILKPNDVITIGKINKKATRFFIDNKIKGTKRKYWPKVVSQSGKIIFVPRQEIDDKFFTYRIK